MAGRTNRTNRSPVAVAVLCSLLIASCSSAPQELLRPASGGATGVDATGPDAFSLPATNLDTIERRRFESGDVAFTEPWRPAGVGADPDRDGLGPIFNADACAVCHVRDGRSSSSGVDQEGGGAVFRVGVERGDATAPHPTYGIQIQDRAVAGVQPEPSVTTTWTEQPGTYADGTTYTLRRPVFRVDDGTASAHDVLVSPRIAPGVIGMGLLEAIPESDVLAHADPEDHDGDGISGRGNRVWSHDVGRMLLGRFGWKAGVATVRDQVALAFRDDIGITSSSFPDQPCSPVQLDCAAAPSGGDPELSDERLADVVFYASTLAVPNRRNVGNADVRAGAGHFAALGCVTCHVAEFTTGEHPIPALAGQTISPFTDLLLHDMGPDLAGIDPGGVPSTEWRTAPLWGLGHVEAVSGGLALLHDGRARTIEEAILWHGGEAARARDGFTALDAADRARVIAFLESL